MGNSTIENLILTEITKYYQNNDHLCDTEFFSILDSDNDGKISIYDMKKFRTQNFFNKNDFKF